MADTPGPVQRVVIVDGRAVDLVHIPSGTFLMGAPPDEPGRYPDEGPQREVTLHHGFYMGRCPVTQAQWEAVMGTQPWSGRYCAEDNPDSPAVYISWNDAQAFISRIDGRLEGPGHFRLPTEAEWEYACRAGTATCWSFGEDESLLDEYVWYFWNAWHVGMYSARPVGGKKPNPWGLYDMHGNIWEWCMDHYGSYGGQAAIAPSGPETGSYRVTRGGDINRGAWDVRSAVRAQHLPDAASPIIGFRLVMIP